MLKVAPLKATGGGPAPLKVAGGGAANMSNWLVVGTAAAASLRSGQKKTFHLNVLTLNNFPKLKGVLLSRSFKSSLGLVWC